MNHESRTAALTRAPAIALVLTIAMGPAAAPGGPNAGAPAAIADSVMRPTSVRHALYVTPDFGRSWTPADVGLPRSLEVGFLETWGRRLVVATEAHGVFIGTPGRRDWVRSGDSLPGRKITAIHIAGSTVYAGVHLRGVFASRDGGRSWRSLNGDLADLRVRAIAVSGSGLLVGTDTGIFLRRPGASAWSRTFSGGQIVSLDAAVGCIVGGGAFGTVLSEDQGRTWRWIHRQGAAHNTAVVGGRVVLMNIDGNLLTSDDWGRSWAVHDYGPRERSYVYDVAGVGPRLVASNNYGIHATDDGGRHWRHVYPTEDLIVMAFARVGSRIYGGTREWGERRPRVLPR